jgi:hypothetical protein
MTCINCGSSVADNFCQHCGQRTSVKRITFKEGWNDFWARIYGFDGMFPRTLKDLTFKPGEVAQKYLAGNRVLYYGPVGYFFLMITCYLLLLNLVNIDIKEFIEQGQQMVQPAGQSEGQKRLSQLALEFVSRNIKWITFIIMPFNAIAARYFLFRKSNLNLVEHMVIPFYISGHMYWLSLITIPLVKAFGNLPLYNVVSIVFMLFYFGIAYSQLITHQAKWKSFSKGVLVPIVGQILLITLISVLAYLVIIGIKMFSPDTLELIRNYK